MRWRREPSTNHRRTRIANLWRGAAADEKLLQVRRPIRFKGGRLLRPPFFVGALVEATPAWRSTRSVEVTGRARTRAFAATATRASPLQAGGRRRRRPYGSP